MCINGCVFASVHRVKYMSPQTHPHMPMSVGGLSFTKYPSCICKICLYFHHQILSMAVIKWLFVSFYVFLQNSLCVNDCCIQESCHIYSQKVLNKQLKTESMNKLCVCASKVCLYEHKCLIKCLIKCVLEQRSPPPRNFLDYPLSPYLSPKSLSFCFICPLTQIAIRDQTYPFTPEYLECGRSI